MIITDRFSLSTLINYCLTDFWAEVGDPRTSHLPLMNTFAIPLSIFLSYLLFVLFVGPQIIMRHRPPLSLRSIIIPYNLAMATINAIFFIKVLQVSNFGRRLLEVDWKDRTEMNEDIADTRFWAWLYLLSKYVDLLDTVFFVLRKKESQITGLHVYHHSMVPTLGWVYLRTNIYHVTASTFALLNTPIHTIMYAYYGMAAFGNHMQPYLWWKRYITQIQIFQFILLFLHGVYFCLFQTGYHWFFSVDVLVQTGLYIILFSRFYLRTYKGSVAVLKRKISLVNGNGMKKSE